MSDGSITAEECAAFGVTQDEAREISTWLLERVGYAIGSTGRGGSGIFVEAPDGRTALLTARHVLIPCILSGEVTVAHYASGKARSVETNALRMASRADAALIFLPPDSVSLPRLSRSDWDPLAAPALSKGVGLISVGAPGIWKSKPDLARRVIDTMKTLLFWTAVIDPRDNSGFIVCDVDENIKSLPSTFRGMSGGPVVDTDRRLVGINKGEYRKAPDGRLLATPRDAWKDLYYPFEPPDDMPTDYVRQAAILGLKARHEAADPRATPVDISLACEFLWSPSKPEHQYGEIGRVFAVTFGSSAETTRYIANTESIFFLPPGHDDESRYQALREEAQFFLESMRYRNVTDAAQ